MNKITGIDAPCQEPEDVVSQLRVIATEHKHMRVAVERLIEALRSMAGETVPATRPTDAEVLYYMTKLEKPLPPIRTIAAAVGWSHTHILKNMPLSAAYFRHHNGRYVRPVRRMPEEEDDE